MSDFPPGIPPTTGASPALPFALTDKARGKVDITTEVFREISPGTPPAAAPEPIEEKKIHHISRSGEDPTSITAELGKYWNTACLYLGNIVSKFTGKKEPEQHIRRDWQPLSNVLENNISMMTNVAMLNFAEYLNRLENAHLDSSLIRYDTTTATPSDILPNSDETPSKLISQRIRPGVHKRVICPFVFPLKGFFSVPHIVSIFVEYPEDLAKKPYIVYYDPQGKKMDDPARTTVFSNGFNLKEDIRALAEMIGAEDIVELDIRNQTDAINCGIHACYVYDQAARNPEKPIAEIVLEFDVGNKSINQVRSELYNKIFHAESRGPSGTPRQPSDEGAGPSGAPPPDYEYFDEEGDDF